MDCNYLSLLWKLLLALAVGVLAVNIYQDYIVTAPPTEAGGILGYP